MRGRGGVPWPFVRRSRFVKELERQGEAYRQNVYSAEQKSAQSEYKLRQVEEQTAEALRKLAGWYEGSAHHFVQTYDGSEPQHFRMEMVPETDRACWTFVFRVSDVMMMHMTKTLDPVTVRMLLDTVTHKLAEEVLVHMYEDARSWR